VTSLEQLLSLRTLQELLLLQLLFLQLTEATLVSLEYTGTATGTDYVASSVTIPAGDLTRTVTIDPTADLILKKTVIATIASGGGNGTTIGTPDSATVTITDEQSVPTVITGTTAIAENAAGVATLQLLSTATTEATLVSLEYTGPLLTEPIMSPRA
jgi:hypothetical protein